jgi:hypothetical protein
MSLLYLNPKQLQFFDANKPYKMFLGGRGSGKSTIEGLEQYQDMATMPKGLGFLAAPTYASLLNITLPASEQMWGDLGMIEGEDYVVGKKPPATFEKSYKEPRKYENVISWANGYRLVMFSMDRPDLNRGGSFCAGALDEAALTPYQHVTKVLLPSIRGFVKEFRHARRGTFRAYTSIPWKPSGYWTLDYEQKSQSDPKNYHFTEATALDNIEALGADYVERLQAEMPYLEFLVEVMNERIKKVQDAFYHRFDPEKHTYTVQYLYDDSAKGIITKGTLDKHYKPEALLDVSFDFSGYFNCAAVFQEANTRVSGRTCIVEHMLHQFFVKVEHGKVAELVDKIAEHYQSHANKLIRLWGEPRGHDPKPDTHRTLFQQIQDRFASLGWRCEIRVKATQVRSHKERNMFINDLLAESNPMLPMLRINDATCKDVIIAMQVTSTKEDGGKDKSRERDRLFPQEHAPHFTDVLDYYLTQKHGHRIGRSRPALHAGT